jgi:hypothetical protein
MPPSRVLVLVSAAALVGCAGRFVNTWLSPDWQGPPLRSVLVVGKAPDAASRRTYEDAMSERLAAIGVRAEPSHRQVPDDAITAEAIARAVEAGGHDGLIAARLVGVDERTRYVPGRPGSVTVRHGWQRWDGFQPGSLRIDRVARIETQVWSLAGEGMLIWAGSSEEVNPRAIPSVARSLADATVGELQDLGVLPRD